ncbi:MAG: DNA adenine methylase, partial [Chloroflexi bacterium]|nr:DNA adenine methylase [Chloroflexota bacterium]
CDPPYLPETRSSRWAQRSYSHEMTADDHVELLDRLQSIQGAVLLCGYPSSLYDQALTVSAGWSRHSRVASTDGGPRTEVVWVRGAVQTTLFDAQEATG